MFRRSYVLRKPTPKLPSGTKIWFDPFCGDYSNNLFPSAFDTLPVERFGFAEVENPEWFEPASDLVPFRPPMVPPSKVTSTHDSDVCVRVMVVAQHNDMCDFCRNARGAIERTEMEIREIAYQTLKQHYEAEVQP
jgi:hypothetical protein